MTLFLILLPFGAFSFLMLVTSAAASLLAAAALSALFVGCDVARGRSVKMLQAGSGLLFAALGAYLLWSGAPWSTTSVRLAADAGVLAIALASLALRTPFTIQYAREMVEPQLRSEPRFVRTNYILTAVWSAAFVLMMAADMLAIYLPSLPMWTGLAITLAARNSATLFTQWYPKRVRAAMAAEAAVPAPLAIAA